MNMLPWLATPGSAFFPLLFIAIFLLVAAALGRRLSNLCAATGGTPAERAVIYACLGAGALQFVPFALAVTGRLDVAALRIAAVAVCLLLVADLLAVLRKSLAAARAWRKPDKWITFWLLALGPAIALATLLAVTPSLDPDGLAYHLTVPKRWMSAGHLIYLPTYPYANAPMGMELLFGWAMAFAGDCAAKCVHLSLGLLATAAIYLAGKRLRGPLTGIVCATIFLVGPAGLVAILGYGYVEGGASLAVACATLAWLIWYQGGSQGLLRVAALLAGIAVSFKISAALFPIALGAMTLLALFERKRESGAPRPFIAAVTASIGLIPLVTAPVVPWFVRAFILTGNPFFPVLASRIPSRDLSPDLAAQVDRYQRYLTWGNSLGREWTLEQRTHVLFAVALAVALLGVLAFSKFRSRMARGTIVIVTITALAQLLAAGLYFRYSLPIGAALLLPVVAPFETWFARRPVMLAWVALTLAFSLQQARHSLLEAGADLRGLAATAAGLEDRRAFLEERLALYPLYERANRDLPADSGVMLSAYCAGFYIDRATFCAEMVQDSLRFTNWDEFTSDLRRLRITHLIAPSALATGGPTPFLGGSSVSVITRAGQFRLVRQLLEHHSRTVATASDTGLYEIDQTWLAAGSAADLRSDNVSTPNTAMIIRHGTVVTE